ncbi:MAG: hypothetical protein IPK76_10600 [Lewinellaceae bacterium]|nr:hypothetical protein [Lewinellaceae bacterium]
MEKPKPGHRENAEDFLPQIPVEQGLLNVLMQRLESAENIQEIEKYTLLIQKIKKEQQELAVTRLKSIEEYRKIKNERRISQVRQIIGLAIGVALAIGGPFVLLYVDSNFGTFLMSVGFTTLGLSSGLVKSFFEKINNKK